MEKDIPVQMPDGITLLADRLCTPDAQPAGRPTILVRSPYGRAGVTRAMSGLPFAERGFNVIIQSCRGTGGSEGTFSLYREREDGLATVEWIKNQPWFDGRLGLAGPSYMTYNQWAIAAGAGPELKALAPEVGSSWLPIHDNGGFALSDALLWCLGLDLTNGAAPAWAPLMVRRRIQHAAELFPVSGAATFLRGPGAAAWNDIAHLSSDTPSGDAHLADHRWAVSKVSAPTHFTAGWSDMFLLSQLRDYEALRDQGHQPHLTIGPGSHLDPRTGLLGLRQAVQWMQTHLLGETDSEPDGPVRLYVIGARRWRQLPTWPPPSRSTTLWLHGNGSLITAPPRSSPVRRYEYHPAAPTPAVGGRQLLPGRPRRDNRRLERRPDVLTYTSKPLAHNMEVIGPIRASISFHSSAIHTDLFVRICDVSPSGRSVNITDGVTAVNMATTADGPVCVELAPTAYRFRRGHRIRVQISSGAHPWRSRNHGAGDPPLTATRMYIAHQEVRHDSAHPSTIEFPVYRT